MESVINGYKDTKPDNYYYSIPGNSGKFVFRNDKTILLLPQKAIKITGGPSSNWRIINEKGTKYYFNIGESTNSETECSTGNEDNIQQGPYTSAWLLTGIATANSNDSIILTYKSYSLTQIMNVNETDYLTQYEITEECKQLADVECTSTLTTQGKLLDSIITNNIKVKFYSSNNRPDLGSPNNALRLDSIEIKDLLFSKKIIYTFKYDETNTNRLWLTELMREDGSGNKQSPYLFEYYNRESLPPLDSKAIDHWGFYNGKTSNLTLLPPRDIGSIHLDGADRDVYPNYAKTGTLTRITYPTNGYTEYNFESNEVDCPPYSVMSLNDCMVSIGQVLHPRYREEIDSFRIQVDAVLPDSNATYTIQINSYCNNTGDTDPPASRVSLINKSNEELYSFTKSGSITSENPILYLRPGWYYIKAEGELRYDTAKIKVTYNTPIGINNRRYAGGLRIKEINDVPLTGVSMKAKYEYNLFSDLERTSGTGGKLPVYEGIFTFQTNIPAEGGEEAAPCGFLECNIVYRTSKPRSTISTTQGSFVGYKNVKIIEGQNGGNGYTENVYTSFDEYPDKYGNGTLCPVVPNDYKRGLLLVSRIYDNQDHLVSKLKNSYSFLNDTIDIHDEKYNTSSIAISLTKIRNTQCDGVAHICSSTDVKYTYVSEHAFPRQYRYESTPLGPGIEVKIGNNTWLLVYDPCDGHDVGDTSNTYNFYDKYQDVYYYYNSEFIFLNNSKSVIYYSTGDSIEVNKNFYYDNWDHYQISRIVEEKNNKIFIDQFLYPEDYNIGSNFIALLRNSHIKNKLIEKVTYYTDLSGNNAQIINGVIFRYDNSIKDQLDTVLIINSPQGEIINKNIFRFSNRPDYSFPSIYDSVRYNYLPDNLYDAELISDNYNMGKITEYHKVNDSPVALLWGYNNTMPVIEAKNTTYNVLSTAVTNITSDLEELLFDVGYLETDPQKTQWRNFNNALRNNSNLSQSLITTYTFSPIMGVTSKTDPNGVTIYFEYDSFGRLKCIKDDEGRILETYQYHYKE